MTVFVKEFYNSSRHRINFVLGLFAAGIILGAAASFVYPEGIEDILAAFAEKFGSNPELNAELAWAIFLNNLQVSVIAWLGGLLLGIAPVLIVLTNGFILGYLPVYLVANSPSTSASILFLMAGLVPHGIIEIPAFLLASVLGLMLGLNWMSPAAKGVRLAVFKENLKVTSQYFGAVVIALLLAAFIEVFVSGKIVNNF